MDTVFRRQLAILEGAERLACVGRFLDLLGGELADSGELLIFFP